MRAGCNGVRLWGVAGEGTLIQTTRTRFKTWPAHLFVSRWRATRCYAASTRRLHCRPPTRAEFVEVIGETLPVNEVSLFLKDGSKVGGNLKIIFLVESRVNFGRWNIFEISLRMDASVEILLYFLLSLFSVPLIIHRAIHRDRSRVTSFKAIRHPSKIPGRTVIPSSLRFSPMNLDRGSSRIESR